MKPSEHVVINVLILLAILGLISLGLKKRKPYRTEHGSAYWASEELLRSWHMLSGQGIVVARSLAGSLISIPGHVHTLVTGCSGSGKGVGYVIPNIIRWTASMVVFDVKGDLFQETARIRQARGDRIVWLKWDGSADCYNPFDFFVKDDPLLVDKLYALATCIVFPEPGEKEPYWALRAQMVLTAICLYILRFGKEEEQTLSAVQDVATDIDLVRLAEERLRELKGIHLRYAGHLKTLFDKDGYSKEGLGVITSLCKALSFLDSEAVAKCVSRSTFDPRWLLQPGTSVYMHIPPHMLDSKKGLLRMWVGCMVSAIASSGTEVNSQTMVMIDEASALGGMPGLEEALVRGRSAGVRLSLIYQSDDQIKTMFAGKPSIIPDNCSVKIYLGAATLETAKNISEMSGSYTEEITTQSSSYGASSSSAQPGTTHNRGGGANTSYHARPLRDPAEVMRTHWSECYVFVDGFPAPILAKRIRYYADAAFSGKASKQQPMSPRTTWRERIKQIPLFWRVVLGVVIWLLAMFGLRAIKDAGYLPNTAPIKGGRTWPTNKTTPTNPR